MLFLAVFCGFLAEYQLEHKIEKQRAKVYAKNLYEELKTDSANINYTIKKNDTLIAGLDTFCLYSSEKKERGISNGMLYYYAYYNTFVFNFTSDNTTIEQLKGSGNLRLMGNKLSQKISEYSKALIKLDYEYGLSRSEYEKMESLYFKIFDVNLCENLFSKNRLTVRDSVFKLNPLLNNDDPKLMKEFTGLIKFEIRIYANQNKSHLLPLKQKITELIALLKNTYRLE